MRQLSIGARVIRAYGAAVIVVVIGYVGGMVGAWAGSDAEGFGQLGYAIWGGLLGLGIGVLLLVPLGRAFGLGWWFGVVAAVLIVGLSAGAWAAAPARSALLNALVLVPAAAAIVTARWPAPLVARLRAFGRRAAVPAVAVVAVVAVAAAVWTGVQNRAEDRADLEAALATTDLQPVTMRDDLGWHLQEVWIQPHAITCVLARDLDQIFVSTHLHDPSGSQWGPVRRLGDQDVSAGVRTGPDVTDQDLEAVVAQLEPVTREQFVDYAAGHLTDGP